MKRQLAQLLQDSDFCGVSTKKPSRKDLKENLYERKPAEEEKAIYFRISLTQDQVIDFITTMKNWYKNPQKPQVRNWICVKNESDATLTLVLHFFEQVTKVALSTIFGSHCVMIAEDLKGKKNLKKYEDHLGNLEYYRARGEDRECMVGDDLKEVLKMAMTLIEDEDMEKKPVKKLHVEKKQSIVQTAANTPRSNGGDTERSNLLGTPRNFGNNAPMQVPRLNLDGFQEPEPRSNGQQAEDDTYSLSGNEGNPIEVSPPNETEKFIYNALKNQTWSENAELKSAFDSIIQKYPRLETEDIREEVMKATSIAHVYDILCKHLKTQDEVMGE